MSVIKLIDKTLRLSKDGSPCITYRFGTAAPWCCSCRRAARTRAPSRPRGRPARKTPRCSATSTVEGSLVKFGRFGFGFAIWNYLWRICPEFLWKFRQINWNSAKTWLEIRKHRLTNPSLVVHVPTLGRVRHVGRMQQQAQRPCLVEAARGRRVQSELHTVWFIRDTALWKWDKTPF